MINAFSLLQLFQIVDPKRRITTTQMDVIAILTIACEYPISTVEEIDYAIEYVKQKQPKWYRLAQHKIHVDNIVQLVSMQELVHALQLHKRQILVTPISYEMDASDFKLKLEDISDGVSEQLDDLGPNEFIWEGPDGKMYSGLETDLMERAVDWCELAGYDSRDEKIMTAFIMGVKLGVTHNGWGKPYNS